MTTTELLSPREAARRLCVAASTIYRWIERGRLPAVDATPTPDGSQGRDRYGQFTPGGLRVRAEDVERLREERGGIRPWVALAIGPLLSMLAVAVWLVSDARWHEVVIIGMAGLFWCFIVRGFVELEDEGECWSCGRPERGPLGLCRDCRMRPTEVGHE